MFYRTLRDTPIILTLVVGLTLISCPAPAQDEAWEGLITAGRSALKLEKFSEAERHFETALEAAEKFPPGDPRLGRSLNNLAAVYYAQEDYNRAEPLMRRSLNVLEETLGPTNADVAQTKKNLAALYYLQGNFTDAEPLLKESLAILEELHGPNHAFVATVLNNLAGLYQAQDRYQDAEPLLSRSLDIWVTLLGNDHPDVVKSRELLGKLREAKGLTPERTEDVKTAEAADGSPTEADDLLEKQQATDKSVDQQLSALGNDNKPTEADDLLEKQQATDEGVNQQLSALGNETEAAAPEQADTGTAIRSIRPADILENERVPEDGGNDADEAARALAALTESEKAAAASRTVDSLSEAGSKSPLPTPKIQIAALSPPGEPEGDDTGSDKPVFAVYLSTLWSKDEAQRYWQALKQEVPDILANKNMALEEVTFDPEQGSFYRVLTVPFTTDPEAQQACDLIKSQVRTHDCNVILR